VIFLFSMTFQEFPRPGAEDTIMTTEGRCCPTCLARASELNLAGLGLPEAKGPLEIGCLLAEGLYYSVAHKLVGISLGFPYLKPGPNRVWDRLRKAS
jgi:hypothetical protein